MEHSLTSICMTLHKELILFWWIIQPAVWILSCRNSLLIMFYALTKYAICSATRRTRARWYRTPTQSRGLMLRIMACHDHPKATYCNCSQHFNNIWIAETGTTQFLLTQLTTLTRSSSTAMEVLDIRLQVLSTQQDGTNIPTRHYHSAWPYKYHLRYCPMCRMMLLSLCRYIRKSQQSNWTHLGQAMTTTSIFICPVFLYRKQGRWVVSSL